MWLRIDLISLILVLGNVESFMVTPVRRYVASYTMMAATGENKRRRRRKQPPGATAPDPVKLERETVEGIKDASEDVIDDELEELSQDDILLMEDVANFEFQAKKDLFISDSVTEGVQDSPIAAGSNDQIPLPDIKQAKRKKEMEEELARVEEEKEMNRPRIKRSDKVAFAKLLEQQPFADADDSFFEEEEYGLVSALLGERAQSFLGIPPGPLQVGHFIGALGIILMAYIEYPGFPLTNLPTPLREALQGGLATVYLVNLVLAGLAAFKASERGQPRLLWVIKTFSVGGLAFDQLTQLPTLEQIAAKKARKGARANKKNKR